MWHFKFCVNTIGTGHCGNGQFLAAGAHETSTSPTIVIHAIVSGRTRTGSGSSKNTFYNHVVLPCGLFSMFTLWNLELTPHMCFDKSRHPVFCSICFRHHPTMPSTNDHFIQQHDCHLNYSVFPSLVVSHRAQDPD